MPRTRLSFAPKKIDDVAGEDPQLFGSGGRTLSNALRVALARAPGKGDPAKFLALLKTLPPGEMTAAGIDREIAEVRSNRGD